MGSTRKRSTSGSSTKRKLHASAISTRRSPKSLVEWCEEYPEDDMKRLPLGQFREGLSRSLTFDFSVP